MTATWTLPANSGIAIETIMAGGHPFEVATAGRGDHLALCLHGFPELHYSWRHPIPLLADMGYRVWAPNLRGYGASYRPQSVEDYRLDHLLGDVAALVDASGAARVTLIAHDWGGALAWYFAIRRLRPIERLVVMNLPHPLCLQEALRHWPQRRRFSSCRGCPNGCCCAGMRQGFARRSAQWPWTRRAFPMPCSMSMPAPRSSPAH